MRDITAFILLKDGAAPTEDDVRDYCRGQIAQLKIPVFVDFVGDDPLSAGGKVPKAKLRELAAGRWPEPTV